MPTLLVLEHGCWRRQELPGRAGHAVLRSGGAAPATVEENHLTGLPTDAVGVILLCEGRPYYLSAPGASTYLNADPSPLMPLHRLRDRDRLTYQGADGSSLRVWYVQGGQTHRCYDGATLGQTCGYCSTAFVPGEEIVSCGACSEVLHTDCLAHGGGKCPRCGRALGPDDEPWLPDGFPDDCEEDDDCE